MMKKIKVIFLAPENKGGPYYIYKDIVEGLQKRYSNRLEVYFFNTKKDWIKLHFIKSDYIFSVVPFLFKPLLCGNYIYNPRGNYELEKKKNNLGNKLLYLSKYNLKFSNNIWLTSYFLADKLKFRSKYENKIFIIPDFISLNNNLIVKKEKKFNNDYIKLLTISSTKFFEKGMGIVDLKLGLSKIKNKKIEWTIIAGGNIENKKKILVEFHKIKLGNNIKIKWVDWVEKEKLDDYYSNTDIFLYGTRLDTWGGTIMEAMNYCLPVILLEYDLWKYIYPNKLITDNIEEKMNIISNNYQEYSKLSYNFIEKYEKNKVIDLFVKGFIKN